MVPAPITHGPLGAPDAEPALDLERLVDALLGDAERLGQDADRLEDLGDRQDELLVLDVPLRRGSRARRLMPRSRYTSSVVKSWRPIRS